MLFVMVKKRKKRIKSALDIYFLIKRLVSLTNKLQFNDINPSEHGRFLDRFFFIRNKKVCKDKKFQLWVPQDMLRQL